MNKILIFLIVMFSNSIIFGQKIGIGINSPQSKLDISGNLLSNNIYLNEDLYYQNQNFSSKKRILKYSDSKQGFIFGPNGKFFIADNGNVGVKTQTPAYKLTINGNVAANSLLTDSGFHYGDGEGKVVFNFDTSNGLTRIGNNAINADQQGNVTLNSTISGANHKVNADFIVNNEIKIGDGAMLNGIIKVTVTKSLFQVASNSSQTVEFDVPNSKVGSSVIVSPDRYLSGVFIAESHVIYNGKVSVRFINKTTSNYSSSNIDFSIAVIQ